MKRHIKSIHYELLTTDELNTDLQTINKSLKCGICNKEFASDFCIKQHFETTHMKMKPFKCDTCSYHFLSMNLLENHIKTVHKGIRDYECEQCNKRFSVKWNLKKHIEKNH